MPFAFPSESVFAFAGILKNPANPEYIVSEPWIGYRFRNPASVARRLI